ncbi:unnamed protein product [Parascedosporium putredinis]|uniref:Smr domain-containing protein n=1 Tax=Parascedosporium putredinis TaxID=1442378 RepID=A0A9P1HAN8_9PEZI|nr:unnamed protein product [Parascedosporium putredinis]CAI8003083.1 unnamed protein product [Parascedosporium putredinis]
MSIPLTRLGGNAFNHRTSVDIEAEYDRLRTSPATRPRSGMIASRVTPGAIVRKRRLPSVNQVLQANARNRPVPVLPSTSQSRQAYENGDGARAKELSNEGKRHAAKMDDYNRQASEFIFRENNAAGRVEEDCIDLHGQFVEEAENILEERIRAERSRGASHLHVIVGRETTRPTTSRRSSPGLSRSAGRWV